MNTIKILSMFFSGMAFITILLFGILTDLLREAYNNKNPYSFSRFQLWLWTLIIAPAFILNWGFQVPDLPSLNTTCLVLLGIPASVTLTAGVVVVADSRNPKNSGKSKGFFTDILMDDNGQFSILRLQQFIFTLSFIAIFVTLFLSKDMKYPDFDETAFVLMGISGGTYLVGKGLKK